ncbi:universal stress protein [Mucilaginibacter sp. KACC 22063]|uniref:universal stress protein n=1 Tax=Mucilaginibacter sp. KACC 22063 TaxID=3025666 RepID=UPI0023664F29|nr:universal stress protein [Mucilaginibacter sp. KACC 22063]WDF55759.1 universal stress protein [Mucilaginibacter sp. KACC 22063]
MRTVLMLTDFSENANHAAKAASVIVPKLKADILLYHTYYNHPIVTSFAGGPWVVEDFNLREQEATARLDHLAIQLKYILNGIPNIGFEPKILYQCGAGSLGKNIVAIIQENHVGLVVIGSGSSTSINQLIFGSNTKSVIGQVGCPVLIIPPGADIGTLKKMTYATGFELADINAINYLIGFCKKTGLLLEIVHVSEPDERDDPVKEAAILNYVHAVETTRVTFFDVKGKGVIGRLQRRCKDDGPAMLAITHRSAGLLSGLFNRSVTEAALDHPTMPLLVIPSDMINTDGESAGNTV